MCECGYMCECGCMCECGYVIVCQKISEKLYTIRKFQRVWASVGGAGGFPPRAEDVGLRVERCISSENGSFDFV